MDARVLEAYQRAAVARYGQYYGSLISGLIEQEGNDNNTPDGLMGLSRPQWRQAVRSLQQTGISNLPAGLTAENIDDYDRHVNDPIANMFIARELMRVSEKSLLARANRQRREAGQPGAGSLLEAFGGDRGRLSFALSVAHRDGIGIATPRFPKGAGSLINDGGFDLSALQGVYSEQDDIVQYATLPADVVSEALGENKLQLTGTQLKQALSSATGQENGFSHLVARAKQVDPGLFEEPDANYEAELQRIPDDAISGANSVQLTQATVSPLVEEEFAGTQVPQVNQALDAGVALRNGALEAGRTVREAVGGFFNRLASGENRDSSFSDGIIDNFATGRNRDNTGTEEIVDNFSTGRNRDSSFTRGLLGQGPADQVPGFIPEAQREQLNATSQPEGTTEVSPPPVVDSPLTRQLPPSGVPSGTSSGEGQPGAVAVTTPTRPTTVPPLAVPSSIPQNDSSTSELGIRRGQQADREALAQLTEESAAIDAHQGLLATQLALSPRPDFQNFDPRALQVGPETSGQTIDALQAVTNFNSGGDFGVASPSALLRAANLAQRGLLGVQEARGTAANLRAETGREIVEAEIRQARLLEAQANRAAQLQAELGSAQLASQTAEAQNAELLSRLGLDNIRELLVRGTR